MLDIETETRLAISQALDRGFHPFWGRAPRWLREAVTELALIVKPAEIEHVDGTVTNAGRDTEAPDPDDLDDPANHDAVIRVWTTTGLLATVRATVKDGAETHRTTITSRADLREVIVRVGTEPDPSWPRDTVQALRLELVYEGADDVVRLPVGARYGYQHNSVEAFLPSLLEDVKAGGRG